MGVPPGSKNEVSREHRRCRFQHSTVRSNSGAQDFSSAKAVPERSPGFRVGVAVADTAGGPVRAFGDTAAYAAASTAKLITAAAYLKLVEAGEARLDETLGNYTAAFQLKSMINSRTMIPGSC
ncbi:serine hydrolase [Pseudarthrobacter cellobiosi]|nr:serine hydrolase [Pseudarthrobacter sp. HLT1-5]MCO4255246.1 serine hydrolase [Pseudarthrobacter sp. HLT1-5]